MTIEASAPSLPRAMAAAAEEIDQALGILLPPAEGPEARLYEAMRYAAVGGGKRLRVIINALTRMRLCNLKGHMDLQAKAEPGRIPPGRIPWFDVPGRATRDITVVFGHWSTLGLMLRPDAICLDSGCVWGGQLTAVRMHDRRVVQIPCEQAQDPHRK